MSHTRFSLWLFPLLFTLLAACNQVAPPESALPQLETQAACVTSGSGVTCTYASTGSQESFTVPAGVTSVSVVARGAPGGSGGAAGPGGRGAVVSATLPVTPGSTLYLTVGGVPMGGNCLADTACIGGFNGGGSSYYGGGGGGASDVRTVSSDLTSRVLVAAGGGGGGEMGFCPGFEDATAGGDAGSPGASSPVCAQEQSTGGGAGTQTAGGAGGSPRGEAGSLGQGADGGVNTGGAGGGGLYGGGGGGTIIPNFSSDYNTAAGAGGGGSSLVPTGGSLTLDDSGTPQIILSYTVNPGPELDSFYTIDFETAPANKILYGVKVGRGVVYSGSGTANPGTIRVDGYQYNKGKRFGGNQVKVVSIRGDKVLTVVKAGTNTPNPTGGELDIKPSQSFGGPSLGKNGLVTLKSITIDGVNSNGAKLILYGNGKFIKTLTLAKAPTQTLTLSEPGIGFIQVRANDSFTVDDVVFEVPLSQ